MNEEKRGIDAKVVAWEKIRNGRTMRAAVVRLIRNDVYIFIGDSGGSGAPMYRELRKKEE